MAATNIRRDIGGHILMPDGTVHVNKKQLGEELEEAKEARLALTHGSSDWYPEQWLPEVAKREANDAAA